MKILITGYSGFLGQEFCDYFSEHELILSNRRNLNMCNKKAVDDFFSYNTVDMVLHTAIQGGTRNQVDTYQMLCNNLVMFNNLKNNHDKYKMMISFGSGAAFDRRLNINKNKEEDIFDRHPQDYYGMAKKIIANEIHKSENIFNMRLFGCFGVQESNYRFIKASISRLLNGEPIKIHSNKFMDFFFVEDLCKVIEFYAAKNPKKLYRDLNICYNNKQTLVDIAHKICNIIGVDAEKNIEIQNVNDLKTPNYTGDGAKLESLNIDFLGLEEGIKKVYEKIR